MPVQLEKGTSLFSLSLTPLVDVVFLLLIFFLVATEIAQEEERQLDLLLPEASEAQPLTSSPRETFVNIDAQGRYFVGGVPLTLDQLESELKLAWVNNPHSASVIIRADKRCPWQFVVAAVNACLKANIRQYRVTARQPDE
jgi:biopolymer transport protein ExbD